MSDAATEVLWESVLDDRYLATVTRTGASTGLLTVTDPEQDNKTLLSKEVTLAYGAEFGPDIGDIAIWQDMVVAAVDGEISQG